MKGAVALGMNGFSPFGQDVEERFADVLGWVSATGLTAVEIMFDTLERGGEYSRAVEDWGLGVSAIHVFLSDLEQRASRVLAAVASLGAERVIVSSEPHWSREAAVGAARLLEVMAKHVRISYHPHDHELLPNPNMGGDTTSLGVILMANPELNVVWDTFWVAKSGHEVLELQHVYEPATDYLHCKDMRDGQSVDFGTGELQLTETAKELGVETVVLEQDVRCEPGATLAMFRSWLASMNGVRTG